MSIKKTAIIFFFSLIFVTITFFIYSKFFKKIETVEQKPQISETEVSETEVYQSNIIKDINYTTKNADGDEYIISASEAEIDYSNPSVLFLTDVTALIKLKNSENITVRSHYGKYNTENFDTIFSKNVIINYIDNKIVGEYLDFSLERNSMIISRNIIFTNLENILKADVIEINIDTKDTKIFMYEKEKKVKIKTKN